MLAGMASLGLGTDQILNFQVSPLINHGSADSISSSGDWLAVGAPLAVKEAGQEHVYTGRVLLWKREAGQEHIYTGRVLLWKREAGLWQPKQILHSPDLHVGSGDFFGGKVVIDGHRMIVGYREGMGYVYAFALVGDTWVFDGRLRAPPLDSDADSFGSSFALSGDLAAVSAPTGTVDGHERAGWVDVFQRQSSGWVHMTRLKEAAADRWYGYHVAISGRTIFVGMNARGLPGLAGGIAVYERSSSTWLKTRNITFAGTYNGNLSRPSAAGNRLYGIFYQTIREYSLIPPHDFLEEVPVTAAAYPQTTDIRGDILVRQKSGSDVEVYKRQPDQSWKLVQTLGKARHGLNAIYALCLTGRELVLGGYLDDNSCQIKSIPLSGPPQIDPSGSIRFLSQQGSVTRLDAGEHKLSANVSPLCIFSAVQYGASPAGMMVSASGDTTDFSLSSTGITLDPGQQAAFAVGFKPLATGEKRLVLTFTLEGSSRPVRTYEITARVLPAPSILQFIQAPKPGLYDEADGLPELRVSVAGPRSWAFRWFKNGSVMPGEVSDILRPAEAGIYQVEASDGETTILSDPAPVGFYKMQSPTIYAQVGNSAQGRISVSGPGVRVRWEKAGMALTDGVSFSGTQTPVLSIQKVQAHDLYTARITMPDSGQGVSASATLQVFAYRPPVIRCAQAIDQAVDSMWFGSISQRTFHLDYDGPRLPQEVFRFRGLPPGLRGHETGTVEGLPTAVGTFSVQVTATVDGLTSSKTFRMVVVRPVVYPGIYWGWLPRSEDLPEAGALVMDFQSSGAYSGVLHLGASRTTLAGFPAGKDGQPSVVRPFPVKFGGRSLVFWLQRIGENFMLLKARPAGNPEDPGFTLCTVDLVRQRGGPAAGASMGNYTFGWVSPSPDPALDLLGNGFGSLKISTDRRATFIGQLADGSSLTGSTWMSDDDQGRLFFYHRDARTQSLLRGGARIDSFDVLTWQRPPARGRLYPGGIGPRDVAFMASRYTVPKNDTLIPGEAHRLNIISHQVQHDQPVFKLTRQHKALFGTGTANPLKAKMDIYSPTGFFTGQFTLRDPDPANESRTITRTVQYRGMMLQLYGHGVGYFLLPSLPNPTASPPTTLNTSPILSGWITTETIWDH